MLKQVDRLKMRETGIFWTMAGSVGDAYALFCAFACGGVKTIKAMAKNVLVLATVEFIVLVAHLLPFLGPPRRFDSPQPC